MADFEWVTARAKCSVADLFEALKLEVKQDVEIRKSLLPERSYYGFDFVAKGREFSAVVQGNKIYHAVTFGQEDQSISVRDEKDVLMLHGVPTLNDEGRCLLKVKDKEYELWQFRKKALAGCGKTTLRLGMLSSVRDLCD